MRRGASIGVLSPFVGGDYYGAIIAGVNEAAVAAGGRVLAIQTLQPGSQSADDSGVPDFRIPLAWDHLDGFLVLPGAVDAQYVAAAQAAGKPVVLVGHHIADTDCPVVLADNSSGIAEAIAHLVEHGHQRIAFSGHLSGTDVRERYQAYCEALQSHGLPVDPDLLFVAFDNHERGGRDVASRMVSAGMPATALLLGTDRNAIGLLDGLLAEGCQLPRDLAVVGFDDIRQASFTEPSLASIRQSLDVLGATGHAVLSGLLDGGSAPTEPVRVPTEFVGRSSCGCPQVGLQLGDEQVRQQFTDNQNLHQTLNTQYELAIELLRTHEQDPRGLAWLDRTPATGGCLGLWPDGSDITGQSVIEVVAAYPPGVAAIDVDVPLPVNAFPSAGMLDIPRAERGEIVFLVPVSGDKRDWGVLAAVGQIQASTPPGREMMNHSGALLAVALEHEEMLRSLREQEDRLRKTALYDQLTGLPNRTLLMDRLTQAGERAVRHHGQRYAVLFIDLDGFKSVNDTYGHAAGDTVLVEVARRLTLVARSVDTAARLGGDEFVLLLEELTPDATPLLVVERIHQALEVPIVIGDRSMRMRASIGVALSDTRVAEAGSLLRLADHAMYREKRRGRRTAKYLSERA